MYKTKALQGIKVLPSLHQPLPLNKRESQRLLETLTTSFRRHLDKEHGWLPDEGHSHSQSASSHRRPTDHHLSSILSNPLFSPPTFSTIPNATSPQHMKLEAEASLSKDIEIFDHAVARGMMTRRRAFGFLIKIKDDIRRSSSFSVTDGMRTSGAGRRVAQWLCSSKQERDMTFAYNDGFMRLLTQFMLAEGLEDQIWLWLERIREMSSSASDKPPPTPAVLVSSLVRAKAYEAVTLDGAYASILRAGELFDSQPQDNNLLKSWTTLSWQSTVRAWRYSPASDELFEDYVAISDQFTQPLPGHRAHLDLHHPNPAKTTPERAVRFFTEKDHRRAWKKELSDRGADHNFMYSVTQLMSLGLDTVKHLSEAGDSDLAQRILSILHQEIEPLFPASNRLLKSAAP